MDDSSFNNWNDSLIKTITQSRQAYGGYQDDVLAISETACKVSHRELKIRWSYRSFR